MRVRNIERGRSRYSFLRLFLSLLRRAADSVSDGPNYDVLGLSVFVFTVFIFVPCALSYVSSSAYCERVGSSKEDNMDSRRTPNIDGVGSAPLSNAGPSFITSFLLKPLLFPYSHFSSSRGEGMNDTEGDLASSSDTKISSVASHGETKFSTNDVGSVAPNRRFQNVPLASLANTLSALASRMKRVRENVGEIEKAVSATENVLNMAFKSGRKGFSLRSSGSDNVLNTAPRLEPSPKFQENKIQRLGSSITLISPREDESTMKQQQQQGAFAFKKVSDALKADARSFVDAQLLGPLATTAKKAKVEIEELRRARDAPYVVKLYRSAVKTFEELTEEERQLWTLEEEEQQEGEGIRNKGLVLSSPRVSDESAAISYFIRAGSFPKVIMLYDGQRWVTVKEYGDMTRLLQQQ